MEIKDLVEDGYYSTIYNEEFHIRYYEWADYQFVGPKAEDFNEELYDEGSNRYNGRYADPEVHRTTDGKLFIERDNAIRHQESLDNTAALLVMDKLEELKILCSNSNGNIYLENMKILLNSIKDSGPSVVLDKWNDSTCY